jgi:hypothetical protein
MPTHLLSSSLHHTVKIAGCGIDKLQAPRVLCHRARLNHCRDILEQIKCGLEQGVCKPEVRELCHRARLYHCRDILEQVKCGLEQGECKPEVRELCHRARLYHCKDILEQVKSVGLAKTLYTVGYRNQSEVRKTPINKPQCEQCKGGNT